MSKVQESLIVELNKQEVELAFRKAAMFLGTIRELEDGHFSIKEMDNSYSAGTVTMGSFGTAFSTDKITNPATVDVYIQSISSQKTEVVIVASCFGGGPIQNNHCKAKLSTVKSAIMVAISESAKQNSIQNPSVSNVTITDAVEPEATRAETNKPVITVVKQGIDNSEKQNNTFKLVAIIFAIIAGVFYIIVSPFWSHMVCYLIIAVFSIVSFFFCVLYLNKDKHWLIQIIAPTMLIIAAISLRIVI